MTLALANDIDEIVNTGQIDKNWQKEFPNVDKTVDKNGNRNLAKGYLNYLYSPKGQELAAKHFFRPRNKQVANKYLAQFPKQKTFNINDVFGGWAKAQKTHFVNGAIFDQIYTEK